MKIWRVIPWALVGVLLIVVAAGVWGAGGLFSNRGEERNTQIVDSVTRSEQVVLLSLGIQGISKRDEQGFLFDWAVPGTERALYLQYAFTAKLGIDGAAVQIEPTGERAFEITIPRFRFLGHDEVSFEVAAENNGIISWFTPEIDPVAMVNAILGPEEQQQYLAANQATLREQAEHFYRRIITAIDPSVRITFVFPEPAPAPAS